MIWESGGSWRRARAVSAGPPLPDGRGSVRLSPWLFCGVFLLLSVTTVLRSESRFSIPFENFRRAHDSKVFGEELAKALGKPSNFEEDISYLISVVSSTDEDQAVQDRALEELFFRAFELANSTTQQIEAFRPAIPLFERHLNEALADTNSKWTLPLLSLTAFAGLQPSPQTIPLFYRVLDAKDDRRKDLGPGDRTTWLAALIAVARLSPRPAEAKKALLARVGKLDSEETMGVFSYALDDPNFLAIFTKYLESTDVEEQRSAMRHLVHAGALAAPALDILRGLQRCRNLDKEVAANITIVIDKIVGEK